MNEQDEMYFQDNFFVIDSNDLTDFGSKLFGFAITEKEVFLNSKEINRPVEHDAYGCFVQIIETDSMIEIMQDYYGGMGIYVYDEDGYFAISNSFLLLCEHLSGKHKLTFNYDYSYMFLLIDEASVIYTETLIKQIKMLPRNYSVSIDKKNSCIKYKRLEVKEQCVPIDCKEGIELIDEWRVKWHRIIKKLIIDDQYVRFHLSGGMDSRTSLSTIIGDDVDLAKVKFFTAGDSLHTHMDDYDIANRIAKRLGFVLNQSNKYDDAYYLRSEETSLRASFLTKCGFQSEIMPSNIFRDRPAFMITGNGGNLRSVWRYSVEKYKEFHCHENFTTIKAVDRYRNLLDESVRQINDEYGVNSDSELMTANDYFYKEGLIRNHDGRGLAEAFMNNEILVSPIMDPMLLRIKQEFNGEVDNDLLYAIIYDRYLPEILDIPFDSDRKLRETVLEKAHIINTRFPVVESCVDDLLSICVERCKPSTKEKSGVQSYLKRLFDSDPIKDFTSSVFSDEVYEWADDYYVNNKFHSYKKASMLIQQYLIYMLSDEGMNKNLMLWNM